MALLHRADLTPGKLELIAGWAPKQPWFVGDTDAPLANVGYFRFDDPHGRVGVETIIIRAGDGPAMQVPLTYRDAPLDGAEHALMGTMQHSVLGTRFTYDAVVDPVYRAELARAILTGGTQVEMWIEIDGVMTLREPTARVMGSGHEADPDPDGVALEIVRVPETAGPAEGLVLMGIWTGHPEPAVLARAARR